MNAVFASVEWPERLWWRANILIDAWGSAIGSDGTSESLTRGRDRSLLREIRFEADAVITGGETVRREGWFFPPNGSLIVLTQLGDLPLDTCPHQDRLLICSDFSDMPAALARLGAQRVLCEGGPRLVKKFLVNDLIDELFISVVSNSLEKEGENAAAVARSAFGLTEEDFELREAVNDDGISFTRFLRRRVTDRSLSSVGKVDL